MVSRGGVAALAAVMLGALVAQPASMQAVDCAPPAAGAPMLVTGDRLDPRFKSPYIDVDEMRTAPVPHLPVLRATSQREGDAETPFARVQNLGRARVVVK
jgi:hypothetical protein